MIYITIKWGEYPQTWPDSQGTFVVSRMTTATDGLSWIFNIYLSVLSYVFFKKFGKVAEIASCLKIQLSIVGMK